MLGGVWNVVQWTCILPASNYMFKVSNRNARTKREISSKITIKSPAGLKQENFNNIAYNIFG